MILGIVGTRRFGNAMGFTYAELLIVHEVMSGMWDGFVTGDAPGVDTLVKGICDNAKPARDCMALAPENRRWEPDGYKARNIKVCDIADALLCIRDPESTTYGSGWTAKYMDSLGKPVTRVEIS